MNQINNEYIKGGLINIIIVEKQKRKKKQLKEIK